MAQETIRRDEILAAMFDVLTDADGPLWPADVIVGVDQRIELTPYEKAETSSGNPRYVSFIRWRSVAAKYAEWIDKTKAGWQLTEKGRQAWSGRPVIGIDQQLTTAAEPGWRQLQAEKAAKKVAAVLDPALVMLEDGLWTSVEDLAAWQSLTRDDVVTWLRALGVDEASHVLDRHGDPAAFAEWTTHTPESAKLAFHDTGIPLNAEGRAALTHYLSAAQLAERDEWDSDDGDTSRPARAWLVRGSNVSGKNLVPQWLREGFVSLPATYLPPLELPVTRESVAAAVEDAYASSTYTIRQSRIDEIYPFVAKMQAGDLVLTTDGDGAIFTGVLAGDVVQKDSPGGTANLRREVDWDTPAEPVDFGDLPAELANKLASQRDVVDLTNLRDAVVAIRSGGESETANEDVVNPPAPVARRTADLPTPPESLAESLHVEHEWLRAVTDMLRQRKQIVLHGPPGTGKTYVATTLARALTDRSAVKLIQFHPSYTYEDFFEGYRPVPGGAQGVQLALRPGPLRRHVDQAREHPETAYVLIIDEINRANLAKVFGELYFLLEYRNENVELMYSQEGDDGAAEFTLPENLYIIGTMNTADRSIALVDTAMRRRFAFFRMHPDEPPTRGMLDRWLAATGNDPRIGQLHRELNSRIDDVDVRIGPSYFMRPEVHQPGGLERMWETSILPLLEEHHFGEDRSVLDGYRLETLQKAVGWNAEADGAGEVDGADKD